ncbi:Ovule protein [Caenorhabditis elegans]|uniref:Ovule protein n=1 Tax=Caenorhabditis elegans TaxID=6239 RepID=Q9N4H9_CAEEL|nr:Ovule protein [Caenorhabditis elegans]CCD73502.2 Ovule protein [Caenorhabditis elegans]
MVKSLYIDSCSAAPTEIFEDPRSLFQFDDDFNADNVQVEDYLEMQAAEETIENAMGVYQANLEVDPTGTSTFWTEEWNEIAVVLKRDERFLRRHRRNPDRHLNWDDEDGDEDDGDDEEDTDSNIDDKEVWWFPVIPRFKDESTFINFIIICHLLLTFFLLILPHLCTIIVRIVPILCVMCFPMR